MVLDRLLPEGDHPHAYGGRNHEPHLFDDFCGFISPNHSENVRYVYVGPNRGRYEESTRGNFHYVGPHNGHYDKEQMPPNHTNQNCARCACLLIAMIIAVLILHWLAQEEPFDCGADVTNWETGWSKMKKEYCCGAARIGCDDPLQNIDLTRNRPVPHTPLWLQQWMPDLGIGAKFIVTVVLMSMLGCVMGASILYFWARYFAKPRHSKTELELVSEINTMLDRVEVPRSDMQVTMSWDTTDDLDLHLTLPNKQVVCAENREVGGFKLDVDANDAATKQKLTNTPVENISLEVGTQPMEGEYTVWAKVYEKHDFKKDASITTAVLIKGHREIYHHRVLPGVSEIRICTFKYPPASHH
mmetsp:Transcript_27163/g.78032  ORF Transcript_27163/g.78032 Transcript_27163/m.78032 type:complete len:357 (-) Transcript_27163:78-1148(-)